MSNCSHGLGVVRNFGTGVRCDLCKEYWTSRAAYFDAMIANERQFLTAAREKEELSASVIDWCQKTFPESQNREHLALHILEEALELCVAVGVGRLDIHLLTLQKTYQSPSESFPGEVADLMINLTSFAAHEKLDLHKEVAAKMKKNLEKYSAPVSN